MSPGESRFEATDTLEAQIDVAFFFSPGKNAS